MGGLVPVGKRTGTGGEVGYSPSLGSQDSLTLHPALRGRGTSEVTQSGRAAIALLPWKAPPTLRVQMEQQSPREGE